MLLPNDHIHESFTIVDWISFTRWSRLFNDAQNHKIPDDNFERVRALEATLPYSVRCEDVSHLDLLHKFQKPSLQRICEYGIDRMLPIVTSSSLSCNLRRPHCFHPFLPTLVRFTHHLTITHQLKMGDNKSAKEGKAASFWSLSSNVVG